MTAHSIFVGIDVSKTQLDLAVRPSDESASQANTPAGIQEVVTQLRTLHPALIVLEATGGLERAVVRALVAANLPVIVANPRQIREFAPATGQLAKTDQLDARGLARFAEVVCPAVRHPADPLTEELGALLYRRRQVLEMRIAEKNRLHTASKPVQKRITAHITGNSNASTATSTRPSSKAPCGRSRKTCCAVCPASAPY